MTLKLDNSIPKDPYTKQLCAVNSYFSVYSAIFGMVTNNQPNEQPGDPSASLLLTRQGPRLTLKKSHFHQQVGQGSLLLETHQT